MLSAAEKTVVAVVAYSAQFAYPLTIEEIQKRLLTKRGLRVVDPHFSSSVKVHRLPLIIRSLVKKNVLIQKGKFVTLAGNATAFGNRRRSITAGRNKERLTTEFVKLVKRIPWVLGVAITGSYAAGGAGERDDVDFLVIAREKRLWLTRLWLLVESWLHGRRPHLPGGDISQSWDLNLWLDETRLSLPPHRQSVYEAYEILQTRWVFERDGVYRRFVAANPWLAQYLARWPKSQQKIQAKITRQSMVLDAFDWLAFAVQIGYRTFRHGRQKADRHSAFFHPVSAKQNIILAWKSQYQRALDKRVVLATGVFDILHSEHRKFLRAAKRAGDILLVGIESDVRVKKLKGPSRPINAQAIRQRNLQRWHIADEVFILPENFSGPEREKLIAQLRPHLLAVSSHSLHLEDKRRILRRYGGDVKVVLAHNPAVSTTQLLSNQNKG